VLSRAEERGLTLSSAGLVRGGETLDTPTEQDVLSVLEMEFVPAPYREAEHLTRGTHDLPREEDLVTVADVRGMLHVHSLWSDGTVTVREMAEEALRLGHAYLGTGDHSRLAAYANGMSVERLLAHVREVRELRAAGLPVLAGAEVDILDDGALDYPDDVLAELDYVVASVHSGFHLDSERQTERLVRAVTHPLVTILGHPTGRLMLRRPSYPVDLERVLEAASAAGTVVEINANAYRLDLDWRVALRWRDRLTFAINTDAHVLSGLRDTRFGVMTARKAGLTARHVVNCLSLEDFEAFVKRQRAARAGA
jgi:DNA polymerase (family 10)